MENAIDPDYLISQVQAYGVVLVDLKPGTKMADLTKVRNSVRQRWPFSKMEPFFEIVAMSKESQYPVLQGRPAQKVCKFLPNEYDLCLFVFPLQSGESDTFDEPEGQQALQRANRIQKREMRQARLARYGQ